MFAVQLSNGESAADAAIPSEGLAEARVAATTNGEITGIGHMNHPW